MGYETTMGYTMGYILWDMKQMLFKQLQKYYIG